jgi:hypothetical protein
MGVQVIIPLQSLHKVCVKYWMLSLSGTRDDSHVTQVDDVWGMDSCGGDARYTLVIRRSPRPQIR